MGEFGKEVGAEREGGGGDGEGGVGVADVERGDGGPGAMLAGGEGWWEGVGGGLLCGWRGGVDCGVWF